MLCKRGLKGPVSSTHVYSIDLYESIFGPITIDCHSSMLSGF